MQPAVHHPGTEPKEDQCAEERRQPENIVDQVARTSGISNERADAVDDDGHENQPPAPLPQVMLRQSGNLQRRLGAHG